MLNRSFLSFLSGAFLISFLWHGGSNQCAFAQESETAPQVLHIFLLAGQSNMEGHGVVDLDGEDGYNGGRGNLAKFVDEPANKALWGDLRAADGSWAKRDDVFVSYLTEDKKQKAGPLSVGYAVYDDAHHFGPELGIGRALGNHFDTPVLLIKTSWGGKSLAKDFRPPSSGGVTGVYYKQMINEFRTALTAIPTAFPALAKYKPQIDGFIWFQGWNDGCDTAAAAEYEDNLVHLIADVRKELGDPTLPCIVGETGNMDGEDGNILRRNQREACERKDVVGARFVPTAQFLRKPEDSPNKSHGHHWFGNGESYLLIGDALGRATIEMLSTRGKNNVEASRTIIDFKGADVAKQWMTVNDGVMGGKSKGGPVFADQKLLFSGSTNTDGGGFSSIRGAPKKWDVEEFSGFILRVRGDGRTYQLDTRIQGSGGRRDISYRANFNTVADQWAEVRVPFSAFKPSWRGADLEGQVAAFDPANLSSMGIMIYDGKDGPFRLEVETIGVYRD
ncbi:MAG: CIA30 family protein [Planctomycetota bacterium]|nr:CIA30 family protein [Planctomycetota bacterium]